MQSRCQDIVLQKASGSLETDLDMPYIHVQTIYSSSYYAIYSFSYEDIEFFPNTTFRAPIALIEMFNKH